MAWDSTKSAGDLITSSDWNSMVTDQKSHSGRHSDGGSDELDAADLSGASGTSGQVLQTDGSAASWTTFSSSASVSEDGTQVLASPDDVNYTTDIDVTDDTDGTVSVALEDIRNPAEAVYDSNSSGKNSGLPTSKLDAQHAVHNVLTLAGGIGSLIGSSTYVTVTDSDVSLDFDRFKDRNGEVFINFVCHIPDADDYTTPATSYARLFRQNAGTAVTGSEVSTPATGGWHVVESGWINFSTESGNESYQIQLKNDGSDSYSKTYYNSAFIMVATPQG